MGWFSVLQFLQPRSIETYEKKNSKKAKQKQAYHAGDSYLQSNFQPKKFSGNTWSFSNGLSRLKDTQRGYTSTKKTAKKIHCTIDWYLLKIISRAKGRLVPARAKLGDFSHCGPRITLSYAPEAKEKYVRDQSWHFHGNECSIQCGQLSSGCFKSF